MEELATKCISDHRQPMVKVNLPGTRLFFQAQSDEEKKLIDEYQLELEKALRHSRVDRRCRRARAVWLDDIKLAKVNKIVKNLLKFWGFQNKNGVFLYPEEMLYLMETNRLDIQYQNIPLTIDQAYQLTLQSPKMNIMKYRVYKKLVSQGYKLLRFEEFANKKLKLSVKNEENDRKNANDCSKRLQIEENNIEKPSETKRKPVEEKEDNSKRLKLEENLALKKIEEIFHRLRQNMPVDFAPPSFSENPDYYVFLPTNIHKSLPDFHLYVCDGKIIDRNELNSDFPNIFAVCLDDVSFYKLGNVKIPFI